MQVGGWSADLVLASRDERTAMIMNLLFELSQLGKNLEIKILHSRVICRGKELRTTNLIRTVINWLKDLAHSLRYASFPEMSRSIDALQGENEASRLQRYVEVSDFEDMLALHRFACLLF